MKPPLLARRILQWLLRGDLAEEVLGDLEEKYYTIQKGKSDFKAKLNYWYQVINYIRPFAIRKSKFESSMQTALFQNYLKVAVRNILKYRVFSFINVFGLSVAMSLCMLIILMLADQGRYDKFHTKHNRIYRILSNYGDSRQGYATSPFPLASAMKSSYPIVEEATHLNPGVGGDATYKEKAIDIRGYFAEPSFFKVFNFELEKGDRNRALTAPNSVVISQEKANQLFGSENPIGKTFEFADRHLPFPLDFDGVGTPPVSWGTFTITGVIDESKYKSHLKFDVLVSASSMNALYAQDRIPDRTNDWKFFYRTYTYVVLTLDSRKEDLTLALVDLVKRKEAEIKNEGIKNFRLEPQDLGDVQLGLMGNDTNNRMPEIGYYFLGFLALAIMLSAALNYTNLSIARALTRAKEIGVRKVTGANRKSLIYQFLSESMIVALLALGGAILLLFLIKPAFKGLWVNQYLNFELPQSIEVYVVFVAFGLLIGLIAGSYPAFHLSTYEPIMALKNLNRISPGKLGFRKVLSVSQFVISLFFIVTSILIFNQFKHFMKFDYGFSSSNIIDVELQGASFQTVSHQFASVPGVTTISASDIIPATGTNNGIELRKSNTEDEYTRGDILITDPNFIANLGIQLISGHPLPEVGESTERFILVNESAVKELGYQFPEEIIGQTFENKWGKETLECVGVIKDFQYLALFQTNKTRPLVLRSQPEKFRFVNVRIESANPMVTIAQLEEKWKQIDPTHPLQYKFFDDELNASNEAVFDLVAIIGFIAFLAIVIACLGLLGMASYTAERKTKEVGIRKVLGADEWSISLLLSREFLVVLVIAIGIGAPLSYFLNNLWLQTLPARVEFGLGTVGTGAAVLLMLGMLTICSQTIRASRRNPVDAIKTE